jgi:hypothetical protein
MSHFTVLVVGENPEEQLQAFHKYEDTGIKDQYVEFIPASDEEMEKYEEKKENFDSFEDFMENYYFYEKNASGQWGRWTNTNGKWDWWQIGGRWTGAFVLKPGAKGKTGTPGLLTTKALSGTVDQALKGDIDFEAMELADRQRAANTWEAYQRKIEETEASEMSDEQKTNVINCEKYLSSIEDEDTKESYIERFSGFSTFAVLMNGKWYEKGSMGWWAIVDNENPQWEKEFKKLLDSIPDGELLTAVDCHI